MTEVCVKESKDLLICKISRIIKAYLNDFQVRLFMRTPMQRKYAIAWRIGGAGVFEY